ncbi:MAG: hypothetical protein ACRCZD_01165 [Phycicoccus sp.]
MVSSDDAKRMVAQRLNSGLDRATQVSRPALLRHIAQSRRTRPEATPAEIIDVLGRRLTAAVSATGAASGGAAAVPGIGTPAALGLALGDAAGFTGVAAMYVLSLAEIHDVSVTELERRRTLLLGVLLGDAGAKSVQKVAARTGPHWGRAVANAVPTEAIRQVNRILGHSFITRYGTRQGVLVLGKQVPFGIGAAIGGVGNAAFARMTIRSAKRAYGPAPEHWPAHLQNHRTHEADDIDAAVDIADVDGAVDVGASPDVDPAGDTMTAVDVGADRRS